MDKKPHSSRKTGKEEYFTLPEVANSCIQTFIEKYPHCKTFLDPCAGAGSFSKELAQYGSVTSLDITPRTPETIKADFTTFSTWVDVFRVVAKLSPEERIDAVVTNPPFGRQSNLAIQFFNTSTHITDTIAFIVPSSWKNKFFIHDKLDLSYHLSYNGKLPSPSFYAPSGKKFSGDYLNCVFQIWEKKDYKRPLMSDYRSEDFIFVRPTNEREILKQNAYDRKLKPTFEVDENSLITVRTHGSRAGEVLDTFHHNPRTVVWLVPQKDGVKDKLSKTDYSAFTESNAYVPCLSSGEIAYCYDKHGEKNE